MFELCEGAAEVSGDLGELALQPGVAGIELSGSRSAFGDRHVQCVDVPEVVKPTAALVRELRAQLVEPVLEREIRLGQEFHRSVLSRCLRIHSNHAGDGRIHLREVTGRARRRTDRHPAVVRDRLRSGQVVHFDDEPVPGATVHDVSDTSRRALRDRWRSPQDTRRAGRLMVGVGVAGMLIAIFGMVVGWIFVGQLASASDDSLDVTLQSLDAIDATIDLADGVLVSTTDGIAALAGTLTAVSGSFDAGTQAIDDIAGLADTIGPSLGDAATTVRSLERIGGNIDSVLSALSSLPLTPEYDSSNGLGVTFGELAGTLEELPGQLSTTAASLTEFTGSADEVQQQLDDLAVSVQTISDDLGDTGTLVDQYRASVADARVLALTTNNDLDNGVILMRILLIVGGVTLLLGQIVPLWLGRSLLDDADTRHEHPSTGRP